MFKWISLTRQSTGAGPPKNRGRVGHRVNLINSATYLPQTGRTVQQTEPSDSSGRTLNEPHCCTAQCVIGCVSSRWTLHDCGCDRVCFEKTAAVFTMNGCDAEIPSLRTGPLVKQPKRLFTLSEASVNVIAALVWCSFSLPWFEFSSFSFTFCSYHKH